VALTFVELSSRSKVILYETRTAKREVRKKSPSKETLSDVDLLRLSAKSDEEAFLIFYRRHQGPVFRFALHMSGSRETAEEVTQEVFLAMLAETHRYSSGSGSLQGYLMGMARNQVRRHYRQYRVHAPDDLVMSISTADFDSHLAEELTQKQDLIALRAAILSLPVNYREVVVLCDLEGVDYGNAAAQLGCAIGTVRSRLHRARAILQAKLAKHAARSGRVRCPA
jgi:RNA polymerase sigma-70 factor, ECF subfamily